MTEKNTSTRRLNLLTGEYILVSTIRLSRPWSQEQEKIIDNKIPEYESNCYLCPGNTRFTGTVNPNYDKTFVFENDFPSFAKKLDLKKRKKSDLFIEFNEIGNCEVLCYSPHHNLSFLNLHQNDIENVISLWKQRYLSLSKQPNINHIQIFETRGKEVGNSAPHPHCQIWSQSSIPSLPEKIYMNQEKYFKQDKRKLLLDYVKQELKIKKRILHQEGDFVLLVPFWAEWPYETYILPTVDIDSIAQISPEQSADLAKLLSIIANMYAYHFQRPVSGAPYIMTISQKPTMTSAFKSLQLWIRFISPLLSPSRLKYQAGYEKSAEPQRDVSPERAADELRSSLQYV